MKNIISFGFKLNALLMLCSPLTLMSQSEIDKPIVFVSNNEADRRVNPIQTTSNDDLVSAKEVILNEKTYAQTTLNADTLNAFFNVDYDTLITGFKLYLKFPDTSYITPKYIKINNLNPVVIKYNVNEKNSFLKKNETITIIYDGNFFQILRRKEKECPENFIEVNIGYCISIDELGIGTFHENAIACHNLNARLCTWSEWYYACQNNNLPLQNMTNNYEWIDTGGVINQGAKVAGNGSCSTNSAVNSLTNDYSLRCCFEK